MSPGALLSPREGSFEEGRAVSVAPHVTQKRYPGGFGEAHVGQMLSKSSSGRASGAIGGPNENTGASGRPRWAFPGRAAIGAAGGAGGEGAA
jgi:hypothetical protein